MKLRIDKQLITIVDADPKVSGSENIYAIECDFSEDWDGYTKAAVFRSYTGDFEPVLMAIDLDNKAMIPSSVLKNPGTIQIGISGVTPATRKPTAWSDPIEIIEGAYGGEYVPEPDPDIWQQFSAILDEIAEKARETVSDAEIVMDTARGAADDAEASKTAAEQAKNAAETALKEAQDAQSAAEKAKTEAEAAKSDAEVAKKAAEKAKSDAEVAKAAADAAKTVAKDAASDAEREAENSKAEADRAKREADEAARVYGLVETKAEEKKQEISNLALVEKQAIEQRTQESIERIEAAIPEDVDQQLSELKQDLSSLGLSVVNGCLCVTYTEV